jgi:F-type H+-transporting ATPase subunit epsilon
MPDGEENVFFAGGGIMEVMPNLVTVLADTAMRADDLDEVAAVRARDDAKRELQEYTDKLEIAAAQAKLAKALAQLQALERMRKKTRTRR